MIGSFLVGISSNGPYFESQQAQNKHSVLFIFVLEVQPSQGKCPGKEVVLSIVSLVLYIANKIIVKKKEVQNKHDPSTI